MMSKEELNLSAILFLGIIGGIIPAFFSINSRYSYETIISILIFINFILLVLPIVIIKLNNKKIDIFSPYIIINFLLIVIYVLKPIYILVTKQTGPMPQYIYTIYSEYDYLVFIKTMVIVSIFITIYSLITYYFIFKYKDIKYEKIKVNMKSISKKNMNFFFVINLIVAILILLYLMQGAGGIANYFDFIGARHIFLKGKGSIIFFINIAINAFTIYTIFTFNDKKSNKVIWVLYFIITNFLSISTGGRSFMIYNFIRIAMIYSYLIKCINWKKFLAVLVVVLLVFIIGFRVVTRDINFSYNKGKSVAEIYVNAVVEMPEYIFGGYDVNQFDNLMTMVKYMPEIYPYQNGKTIAAMFTGVIPRQLMPEKPSGGMEFFAKTFYNEYYKKTNGTEISASMIGDLYMNFGTIGIIIFTILFTYILNKLYYTMLIKGETILFIIYLISIFRLISLIRGDFRNFFINYAIEIVQCLIFYICIRGYKLNKGKIYRIKEQNINENINN